MAIFVTSHDINERRAKKVSFLSKKKTPEKFEANLREIDGPKNWFKFDKSKFSLFLDKFMYISSLLENDLSNYVQINLPLIYSYTIS